MGTSRDDLLQRAISEGAQADDPSALQKLFGTSARRKIVRINRDQFKEKRRELSRELRSQRREAMKNVERQTEDIARELDLDDAEKNLRRAKKGSAEHIQAKKVYDKIKSEYDREVKRMEQNTKRSLNRSAADQKRDLQRAQRDSLKQSFVQLREKKQEHRRQQSINSANSFADSLQSRNASSSDRTSSRYNTAA